jgi:uncharacterized membrane protein
MRTQAVRRVTVRYTWDRLKVSFWFAPVIMALAAILLAWAMYWLDTQIANETLQNSRLVLSGSPDSLRAVLITMASTVLTTAGVVFTLLTLPLSTVASQYGSRLLRVFLGDRITQAVLGMFVATFVYCMAAALSIPPAEVEPEGPQLTATVGLYLMLATFASLILLVQHISTMLQAPNIAAGAGAQLMDVVAEAIRQREAAKKDEAQGDRTPAPALAEAEGYPVRVKRNGYVQYVDLEQLLTLARENDLVLQLVRKPGAFVWNGSVLALAWPAARAESLARPLRRAIHIGNTRTPAQDIEYAINQLTEMAVRAMSPAINDPFTAMTCLDHMGHGLALFAQLDAEQPHIYGARGRLRLVFQPVTLDELLNAAFDKLRHAACNDASVLLHMLKTIEAISEEARAPEVRQKLQRHVTLIQTESQAGALIEQDRQAIHVKADALQSVLQGAP